MRAFLGTYRCICGKRVRVYDILPECPLCSACERDIARQERAMTACEHDWQEQPGEPPVDVCNQCGARRE